MAQDQSQYGFKKAPVVDVGNRTDNEIIQRSHLEFLYDLHCSGIALSEDQHRLLVDNDFLKKTSEPVKYIGRLSPTDSTKWGRDRSFGDRVRKRAILDNQDVIQKDIYETDIKSEQELVYTAETGIRKSDWAPDSIINHSREFVDWIDSINAGFRNRIMYEKFERYKDQADEWYGNGHSIDDFEEEEQRYEYMIRELERCSINSLYAANKYFYLKDEAGEEGIGKIKYFANEDYEHQRICCYLFDCGYSLIIGKPRQPGITSIFGILGMNRCLSRRNYFLKFIAENKITSEEIFEDKIKFSFSSLEGWFMPSTGGRPDVLNDRDNLFKIGRKGMKGKIEGINSKIQVTPPYKTAINGGSPPLVFVDEIGTIDILTEMINEGRPTMFRRNKETGEFEIKSQIILWGCVCAGTKIWTKNGDLIKIEDLKPEQGILGYDYKNGNVSKEKIIYWQPPKEKECYRITTHTGRILECSYDHPILWSKNAWGISPRHRDNREDFIKYIKFNEAKNIYPGDHVAIIEDPSVFGNSRLWEPRLLGWLLGDGSYAGKKTPILSNADYEIHDYLERNFKCVVEREHKTLDGKDYKEIRISGISGRLREAGMRGADAKYKSLPKNINSCVKKDICEFLGGYFDADGCVHYTKGNYYVDLTSSDYSILDNVRMLLQKLGIHCNITLVKANPGPGSKDVNDWYELSISAVKDLRLFYKTISFTVKYKQDRLNVVVSKIEGKKSKLATAVRMHGEKGRLENHGLRFEKVINVESIGMKPVYNLTAGTTNTYIANGIVTHNTGTSGKGGGAFENEWKRVTGLWDEKKYEVGIVPLFLDWTTRCNDAEYLAQKNYYYGSRARDEGIDQGTSRVQFHQHYPSSPSDMFATTQKTLIDRELIDSNLKRIYDTPHEQRARYGYFVPIFDKSIRMDENSDVPYKIIGADFEVVDEMSDLATTMLFHFPKKGWIDRYYQGTDPIAADTGTSLMASAIWDAHYNTVSALVNYREPSNPNASFLQCLLAGLFYGVSGMGVPELVEKNIGLAYRNYKDTKGFLGNMMYNAELPAHLQSGPSSDVGIDNKGHRNKAIINEMYKVYTIFGDRIYIPIPFEQLKTFVCNITRSGNDSWGPVDNRYYHDDAIWAIVYAYIAANCYSTVPKNTEVESKANKVIFKSEYDKDYNLIRVPVKQVVA